MTGLNSWDAVQEWHRRGENFLIVVRRSIVLDPNSIFFSGPNRWCVYAYIYPEHPIFSSFEGEDVRQTATSLLPLHHRASQLRWHFNFKKMPCSIQVGADYSHHRDDRFATFETPESAWEVFQDAEKLFDHLSPPVKE